MKEKIIISELKKIIVSIDTMITSLDYHMKSKDFAKIASESKRGETELMKFKMVLAGLKKVQLTEEDKKELKLLIDPLREKANELSLISETNAVFYSGFLNILSSLIASNYNDKGKMAVKLNNTRISHSI